MEQSEYTDQMIIKLIKQILELNSVQFMKHQITKAAVLRLKDFKIIIQNSSDMQHQLRCGQACIFFSPSLSSLSCFLPSCYFLLSGEDVGHCFLAGQPAGGMVFSCVFSSHTCSSLTNQLMIFKNQLVLLHSTITVVNRPPFFFFKLSSSHMFHPVILCSHLFSSCLPEACITLPSSLTCITSRSLMSTASLTWLSQTATATTKPRTYLQLTCLLSIESLISSLEFPPSVCLLPL